MQVDRCIRSIFFSAALLAASAGAQEGEPLDIPDPAGPVLDEMVFEEKVFEAEPFADEALQDQVMPGPTDQLVPVATDATDVDDTGPSTGEAGEATELTDVEMLIQEFARYKELMENGVYDVADTAAKRVIELSIKVTGPASIETARALTNLATVQHNNRQFDTAEQNYAAAIEIIEVADNRLSKQLINPLRGLGTAQLEGGQPEVAMVTFNRAVHLTHVNEGPHNLDQIELLQALAEVSLRLGETKDARDVQDRIYLLNVRRFASDSMGLVPTLLQRAKWQHQAGLIIDERMTYRRAIQIIEKNEGKNSLLLIEPLMAYGGSFLHIDITGVSELQRNGMGTGEIYYKRAARIAGKNPDADWRDRATTMLALGDYYMKIGSGTRAEKAYIATWEMLSFEEDQLEFRRNTMGRPSLLRDQPLPQYLSSATGSSGTKSSDQLLPGTLVLSYNINEYGRVSSIRLVQAEPPEFTGMQHAVARIVRSRTYRPRFSDGQPAASNEQILDHTFYYRQADLEALRVDDEAGATPQEETTADTG
jgi:tetratricopeptide (TPR) repeat protein